jgi:hypothetical protein
MSADVANCSQRRIIPLRSTGHSGQSSRVKPDSSREVAVLAVNWQLDFLQQLLLR